MSGDYTRFTFEPAKNYSGVLKQQGRVDLDADWNELVEIQDRRWRTETIDIIGRCVVPNESPDGFKIAFDNDGTLTIGPGRIYVDGLLAENHGLAPLVWDHILGEMSGTKAVSYNKQPFLPNPPDLPTGVSYLVYLDVWQREVTYIEDPELLEKALGGPDTTARLQTVWQVKILKRQEACLKPDRFEKLLPPSAGRLTTSTNAVPASDDPCVISPAGGYKGLENRLYRVEIHTPDPLGTPRFKWSRDNGSVVSAIEAIAQSRDHLTVQRIGRDQVLRFNVGDWVEVLDDHLEFQGKSGHMAKVTKVDESEQILTIEPAIPASLDFDVGDTARHTRVRRWDQGKQGDADGLLKVEPGPIDIEDGIQVSFSADSAGGDFKEGDYWVFAARTADGSVEQLDRAPPRGIHHHYCSLAVVSGRNVVQQDCREKWPPAFGDGHPPYWALRHVGGDGQQGQLGKKLPCPLIVGVEDENGTPLRGEDVQFKANNEDSLTDDTGNASDSEGVIVVTTNLQGLAQVWWTIHERVGCHRVEASLVAPPQGSALPIQFETHAVTNAQVPETSGIRIESVRLNNTSATPLLNDSNVDPTVLKNGIRIQCEESLDPASLKNKPVCYVTIEVPFLWKSEVFVGYQPIILAAEVDLRDTRIIEWNPEGQVIDRLPTLVKNQLDEQPRRGVLAHLHLEGNFIWGRDEQGKTRYLDGESFGKLDDQGTTDTHIDIPSGDGRPGGPFHMWFWLVQ